VVARVIGVDPRPEQAAVVMGQGGRVTYAELEERSSRWAAALRKAGLAYGDHLALLAANEPAFFELGWATYRSGLYCTPVNRHLTAAEAAYIVADCGARALVATGQCAELAERIAKETPDLELRVAVGGPIPGFTPAADILGPAGGERLADERVGSFMLYSSGTTGYPKGILRPLSGEHFTGGSAMNEILGGFGFGKDTVYLCPGPLYHAAPLGYSFGTQGLGGTVVVMERFDAEDTLRLIERHRVTHVQFVPTMMRRIMALPAHVRDSYDVSSLVFVIHAAAPCPVELKREFIDWLGPVVWEYYAGSESTGFLLIGSADWLAHPGSVGRPIRGVVHICDEAGVELPAGEVGTIWFSDTPDFVYHNDPVKTAAAHNDRGWTTLGDLGSVDAGGYLYLSDRRADLILSGGVNVYPLEVENALSTHPAIADVAVIGLPDEDLGERVTAVVELIPGASATGAEIVEWSRERLAHFKCPRQVEFVAALPRLPTGKLLRRRVRDQFGG
jgi:long-chain acyl-CoA synthetase